MRKQTLRSGRTRAANRLRSVHRDISHASYSDSVDTLRPDRSAPSLPALRFLPSRFLRCCDPRSRLGTQRPFLRRLRSDRRLRRSAWTTLCRTCEGEKDSPRSLEFLYLRIKIGDKFSGIHSLYATRTGSSLPMDRTYRFSSFCAFDSPEIRLRPILSPALNSRCAFRSSLFIRSNTP